MPGGTRSTGADSNKDWGRVMKYALLLTAGLLGLAACGGAGETGETETSTSSLKEDCLVIAADPEGVDEIAEMGTDAEGFCSCLVQLVDTLPEEEATPARDVLAKVAAEVSETGGEVEEVVGSMMSEAMANPEGEGMQDVQAGVRTVGDLFDDIGDGFDDTGSCPA